MVVSIPTLLPLATLQGAVRHFLQFRSTATITAVVFTGLTALTETTRGSVFTPVQLLWIDLVLDILVAFTIVFDRPPERDTDKDPAHRHLTIVTPTMWRMIIGQAIYQLAVLFTLKYGAHKLKIAHEEKYINVLVFNTFVWLQMFNQYHSLSLNRTIKIQFGLAFYTIQIIVSGFQILIIFRGGIPFTIPNENFPQNIIQWAVAVSCGLLSIPVGILLR
ncbi:hypothetical protein Micbo1qcDRAFT_128326, partial [Microdochium bolleyi]